MYKEDSVKKKIIIAVIIILTLGGAFFFAEKPSEEITERPVPESSVHEISQAVSEKSAEESSKIIVSEISVEESSEIIVSEISVEESSEIIVSEISVEESSEEIISEVSFEESSEEIVSEISFEESSFIENSVEEIPEIAENKTFCTVSISCSTLLDNLDRVKKNKLSVIPSDGWILTDINAEFTEGESVFDVTKRVCMERKIPFEFTLAPIYNTAYIEGINNIYEFDCGSTSGWLYKVNGEFKSYGCSDCKLNNGDIVEWVYTCNLGKDVGNEYKGE